MDESVLHILGSNSDEGQYDLVNIPMMCTINEFYGGCFLCNIEMMSRHDSITLYKADSAHEWSQALGTYNFLCLRTLDDEYMEVLRQVRSLRDLDGLLGPCQVTIRDMFSGVVLKVLDLCDN